MEKGIKMGYNTIFKGVLKFKKELIVPQIVFLNSMFGEDLREHSEWLEDYDNSDYLTYINLRFTKDYTGIEWNDSCEKTYNLDGIVNVIIENMRKHYPDFELEGKLIAQGEDIEDRWELIINDNGFAEKRYIITIGDKIICPHCECEFYINEKENI